MTALAADRNTPRLQGDIRQGGLAASVLVYAGAIVMRNASGYLTKGATALGLVGVGRAQERKTGGVSAGDETLGYLPGIFRFANPKFLSMVKARIGEPAVDIYVHPQDRQRVHSRPRLPCQPHIRTTGIRRKTRKATRTGIFGPVLMFTWGMG
jgi:hypothetical protein